MADKNPPMMNVEYYNLSTQPLSEQQFTHNGLGMFDGPRGSYGRYAMGPVTKREDIKGDRHS